MIAKSCPEHSFSNPDTLVAISGSGNVAQYAALKVIELGAKVVSLSDSKGSITSATGFTKEDIEKIGQLKLKGGSLESVASTNGWSYHAGQRPWTLFEKLHIALPCATQNEVSGEEAEALVKAGVRIVAEGSNMGCTLEAIEVFEASRRKGGKSLWYAPGKASNCGGVAVSGLEMAQNSQRLTWTTQEVDSRLNNIMTDCYNVSHLVSQDLYILLSDVACRCRSAIPLDRNGVLRVRMCKPCPAWLLVPTLQVSSRSRTR